MAGRDDARGDDDRSEIEQLIRDAGREPVERDTLYNVVRVPVGDEPRGRSAALRPQVDRRHRSPC